MKTLQELEKEYPPDVSVFKVVARPDVNSTVPMSRPPWTRQLDTAKKAFLITLRVRYAYWIIDPNTCEPFSEEGFVTKQLYAIDELDALKNAMTLYCGRENIHKIKHDLYKLRDAKQKTIIVKRNSVTTREYSTLFKQKRKVRK